MLITGDAIDKAKNISILNDFLKLINKDIKKVAILGNWEYWGGINLKALKKIYTDNNCTLRINQTTQFKVKDKTISITGVDDYLGGKANIETATKDHKKSDYHIM